MSISSSTRNQITNDQSYLINLRSVHRVQDTPRLKITAGQNKNTHAISVNGPAVDHSVRKERSGRTGVVVVMLCLIAAFSGMIIAAYSSNISGAKRPPAVSKEFGQYQTSQFSPEAKQRDSEDIAALQTRYMNSRTEAERKQVIQELHRRLATIPYGTLSEDQQKFVALFY